MRTVVESAKRNPIFDNAKAVGIILVAIGHAWPASSVGVRIIYGFHMPLFFFLSGALLKDSAIVVSWREFVGKQFRSLIVPYVFFGLVSAFLLSCRQALSPRPEGDLSFATMIMGLIIGNGRSTRAMNSTLWFFIALFVTSICYFSLARRISRLMICFLAGLSAAGVLLVRDPASPVLPWDLDIVPLALCFYAVGRASRQGLNWLESQDHRVALFTCGALLLIASGLLALLNPLRVDMREMIIGNGAIFFATAFIGIAGTLVICSSFSRSFAAEYLSISTIVVFPMHVWPLMCFSMLDKRLFPGVAQEFVNEWWRGALYALFSVVVCLPLYYVLSRYAPICIGGRSRTIRLSQSIATTESLSSG